jgi:hypothetical protein
LEALIRTYFDPAKKDESPSVCRFIARYTWLKEKLSPDPTKIPFFDCPSVENIQPRSAVLAFPTYFLNNPASMFGHTFLNIETGYSSTLLTNAVNYAADASHANAFQYTIYGILGGFKGYFSVLPYYKKIQEYSDIDQRDIWEYRLNLTEPELKRMVLHIRELEGIHTTYYFFKRNCSYYLLFLLEAARPSLKLTDEFGPWVIPIDTVKLMDKQGLVESAQFRPSNGTKIRQKLALLSPDLQDLAYGISMETVDPNIIPEFPIPNDQKIIVSDLVGDYLKYRLVKQAMPQTQYQAVALPNLRIRSRLGAFDENRYKIDIPPDPETGHDSARVYVSAGSRQHESFQEIGINPAFTDLLNTDYTRREGMQIQFLDTRIRYTDESRKLELERLDLFDIVSLFPRNKFFKPLSWAFNTGFRRELLPDGNRAMMYRISSAAGLSWDVSHAGLCYVMPEMEFRGSGKLEKNVALGAGVTTGVMKDILPWWKMLFSAHALYFQPASNYHETRFCLDQNFRIDRNNRLLFSVSHEDAFDHGVYEGSLAVQRFF